MNTFHDLFRQPTRRAGAGFPPDRRRELFPGFVERSPRLRLWVPGQSIPAQGSFLLLGVATWSGYDMNLLDLIEGTPDTGIHVEVLDVDTVSSAEALARLFPGVALLQTPFVGYWLDGKLTESASGFEGRKLVARVCGLNLSEVEDRMKTVTARV
jgi:hypothetical protein